MELAQLGERLGFDERVLYTDCDVFFKGDPCDELATTDCRYFAVAPESAREDYLHMNTGVMWMNLAMLRDVDAEFRRFARKNLARTPIISWR